jgi:hypothetical protein
MRKWPGLGANAFDVDFASMLDAYKEFKSKNHILSNIFIEDEPEGQVQATLPDDKKNELSSEIEIPNTEHHKAIIKARNEAYAKFKTRFESSLKEII